MLNPALCSQSKERESESKIPCRKGSCSVMVSVLDLSLEGRRIESRKQSKHVRKKQFSGAWKNVFLQSPISSHKTIRGHATKKMNRKGELQTSRKSSNLRIWQSYSRAPQILKVLCVWSTWKYVARLGFEPLKFLYSEFLYNTQAVHTLHALHTYLHTYIHTYMTICQK